MAPGVDAPRDGRAGPGVARSGASGRREEDPDLAGGRLGRVGAVHEVLADLEGEVAADRAGGGLDRVGRADQAAAAGDGVRALDDERDERAAGDELDQLAEEGALLCSP